MTSLSIVSRIPDGPEGRMACEYLRAQMAGRVCIERQAAVVIVRGARGARIARPDLSKGHCSSGKCVQGAEVRAALPDFHPQVSPNSNLERQQRVLASRAAAALALLMHAPTTTTTAPAEPVQEPEMAEPAKTVRTCARPGCARQLRSHNKSDHCKKGCKSPEARPSERLANGERVAAPKPLPRTAAPARRRAEAAPANGSDIEQLLEHRLAHHRIEATRIERALAALRS